MKEILKNILILAYSLAKQAIAFSETEKRVFTEFAQSLDKEFSDFPQLKDQEEINAAAAKLATKEEKTLLLDLLLLLVLSQGNLEREHTVFLYKAMHKIQFQASDYLVFSINISFDEFIKRQDINLDNLYRMLWTKVGHVMRKQIFLPQWSKSLACSISGIDKQHKALIDHFASYVIKFQLDQPVVEVKKMLSFLQGYANDHFKTEEVLMSETQYPFMERHLNAHKAFRRMFIEQLDDFRLNKNLETLREGVSKMLEWFLNHIRKVDLPTCFYLKYKQASTVRKNQLLLYHDDQEAIEPLMEAFTNLGVDRLLHTETEKESWDWIQTGDVAMVIISSNGTIFKGVDLLSRIRKNNNQIPVLLMPTTTNQNDLAASIKRQRLNHPQNQILLNPFQMEDLVRRLQQALFQQ